MTLIAGTRLGQYEILSPIGTGGMGEVYRARDTRLGREVAIKVLPESLATDSAALARFEREAHAVAAVNHPNILTIYEVGTFEGAPFLVAELLEGETLGQLLSRGRLPQSRAIELSSQIALGLAAAHEKGIVHRDLKPANLFVTRDSRMKILDFGLAKQQELLAGSTKDLWDIPTRPTGKATDSGIVMGTVGYMSPEQVRGLPADYRSDIFSFGVVLYEMLTGIRAFQRDSAAETMSAILRDPPPPLEQVDSMLDPEIRAVVLHCLEKDARDRFQATRDLAFALRLPESRVTSGSSAPRSPEGPSASIAVLPFRNMSPDRDAEYFSDGMTEEIINALMKIDALRVAARTSSFAFKGKDLDIRSIGERLGVRCVLEGSVRQAAGKLRITVQLISAADGYQLWSGRYDRALEDVFAVQDEIARAIADTLELRLLGRSSSPLVSHVTRTPEAYDLYLKGRYFFNHRVAQKAIEAFEASIAADPGYAPAYTGLADSYGIFAFYGGIPTLEAFARARAAVQKASELAPGSAEVHISAGIIEHYFGWDAEREDRELREALRKSPQSAGPSYWLGLIHGVLGRMEEGLEHARRAARLEPLSPVILAGVGWPFIGAGRFAEGAVEFRRALDIDPNAVFPLFSLGIAHQHLNEPTQAVAVYERLLSVCGRSKSLALGLLGGGLAAAGRTDDARRILDELRELSEREYVAPLHFALVQAQLGDTDAAVGSFERACDQRNAYTWYWAGHSPLFAALRSDVRFAPVLAKIVPA